MTYMQKYMFLGCTHMFSIFHDFKNLIIQNFQSSNLLKLTGKISTSKTKLLKASELEKTHEEPHTHTHIQRGKELHPWRLTWNIIMEVWKIIFLSKWVICMFHVNLPGCTPPKTSEFTPENQYLGSMSFQNGKFPRWQPWVFGGQHLFSNFAHQ